jgi:hypothetical protein
MVDVGEWSMTADRSRVSVRSWSLSEPPRSPSLVPGGDIVPALAGVDTTVSVVDVTDPRYSLRNGFLVDPDRRVVAERGVVGDFPILGIALKPLEQPRHVAGVVASLAQADNYGHWLTLALPLLNYYRDVLGSDADYYYVGSNVRSWQIESLEMLGVPRTRILDHAVTAERILVAIADRRQGYDAGFLRYADRLMADEVPPSRAPGRRILVSRARARFRRLVNEAECAAALQDAYGVEPVFTETLSLRDEIALFRDAQLVVGVQGAGLINCVFAPPGSVVVELASETYWFHQTVEITCAKHQRYALLRGAPTGVRLGIPPAQHDFEIDVPRVIDVVGAALTRHPASV